MSHIYQIAVIYLNEFNLPSHSPTIAKNCLGQFLSMNTPNIFSRSFCFLMNPQFGQRLYVSKVAELRTNW